VGESAVPHAFGSGALERELDFQISNAKAVSEAIIV
jgi:hypothetical protein